MKNILVIYHKADFDGIFCREIAKKFLGDTAEYIGWDHGDPYIPMPNQGIVYVLDLSPDCLDARQVESTIYNRIIWIDHHKSSIEKWSTDKGIPPIKGYRIDGVAACRLTWQWFWNECHDYPLNAANGQLPDKLKFIDRTVTEPLAVQLAGEYDIWDKRNPDAELFQHGLRSRDLTERIWERLLVNQLSHHGRTLGTPAVAELLDAGTAIQYAKTQENADIIKNYGFDFQFEGLNFLACNSARYNSHLFTAGLRPDHDACFGFKWDGNKFSVSLYHAPGKEHHDLSLIAVKYGGGGHRGACGFSVEKLPFINP